MKLEQKISSPERDDNTLNLHDAFRFQPVGEGAVMLYSLAADIETQNSVCRQLAERVMSSPSTPQWFYDVVPSYDSIIIHFDCLQADQHDVYEWLATLNNVSNQVDSKASLVLPICYTLNRENDLSELCKQTSLKADEIIQLHSKSEYNVYAIGFAPGFAYMGFVSPALQMPRKATPRAKVPMGAVAIADRQTAIYPSQSPGGWNIIGYCPLSLLNMDHQPISPFSVGQKVLFDVINESQFLTLEGTYWHDYQNSGQQFVDGDKL